ncbi:hypothetical protein LZZ85_13540 [Terrimonas sp. NA20]|uniref:Uncharacterized protein n=1 Tax=Terrimonas ginsenosidimutans TaxID=2908004 RepID=A0ABS9KSQ4_9BACT|nr:hypothetical protein [Terrimonas ginsenosidimutans]MCG2615317.1 hypothetical protein [Terrimonas ginsenosidimutans]
MKHATDTSGEILDFDFSRPGVPSTAESLHPVLTKQENHYLASWTTEMGAEISGSGDTPEIALQKWDEALQQHLLKTNTQKKLSDELAALAEKRQNASGDARKAEDTEDVKEGLPIRSEINPENTVEKKPREHTADDSNQNGSE